MNKTSFHILRVGLAITFLWIGVLIFKDPEAWGSYISNWALKLMPISIHDAMISTAFLDVIIGGLLLLDYMTWLAAFVGFAHLVIVLTVSGINEGTVRDIAIIAGAIALVVETLPQNILGKIKSPRVGE